MDLELEPQIKGDSMIKKINGVTIKPPSSLTWGLMDLSSEESGRTLDGNAHKDVIATKIKFDSVWNAPTQAEASVILNLVCSNVFVDLTYDDPLTLTEKTKKFYTGDKSAPVSMWNTGNKMFTSLSFNFIEK